MVGDKSIGSWRVEVRGEIFLGEEYLKNKGLDLFVENVRSE